MKLIQGFFIAIFAAAFGLTDGNGIGSYLLLPEINIESTTKGITSKFNGKVEKFRKMMYI